MSRRKFVKASGLGLVSLGLTPIALRSRLHSTKTLVCVFQRGAVDGLSMVVPHGDPLYHRLRPHLAIPKPDEPDGVVDLDGYFGLHPALRPLARHYRSGALGAVHAVGLPEATRSHFDAQADVETGTPGVRDTADGWANRVLASTGGRASRPLRGVAIGPRLPRALLGGTPARAITDPDALGVLSAAGARYPGTTLGRALRAISRLIKDDVGIEIALADTGGWDTHVDQGVSHGPLAHRLRDLAQSLAAFATDLGHRMADVVVLTISEFGRTTAENDYGGTDHGRGTAMLLLGGPVAGGSVLGRWPGLDHRPGETDLAVTTDFRDVLAEVLVKHLGVAHLGAVFPRWHVDAGRWVGAVA